MKLLQTTKTQEHLLNIEKCINKTNRLISATIQNVNSGYDYLWKLPDNELQDVLQELVNNGKIMELFNNHYNTATSLNKIQDDTGIQGDRALAVAGREFVISDIGVVTVTPIPVEPIPEEPIIE